jgi:hypothetical protein
MLSSSVVAVVPETFRTGEFKEIIEDGMPAASAVESVPIPPDGTALLPVASIRRIVSKRREETSKSGSN